MHFSIMFKSGDCAGQVIPGIAFSIFQSRVNLELCAGTLSSWNINACSAPNFRKFYSIIVLPRNLSLYTSGFQTGVRGPKGVCDGFPWGPREDSEK